MFQTTKEHTVQCTCFMQVVCEPVLIFYQQARGRAGHMAPNDVTSSFNKTLQGRVASLNTNKNDYAISFSFYVAASVCHLLGLLFYQPEICVSIDERL